MRLLLAVVLAAALALPSTAAAYSGYEAVAQAQAQAQPAQMMDLNLMEALITVGAPDLAGVFSFVPEQSAPAAFADYVLHNRKAFKRFMKKSQRDLKELNGVSAWDRTVFIVILQMNGSVLPPGVQPLTKKEETLMSAFILAHPLSLQEINAARGMRR